MRTTILMYFCENIDISFLFSVVGGDFIRCSSSCCNKGCKETRKWRKTHCCKPYFTFISKSNIKHQIFATKFTSFILWSICRSSSRASASDISRRRFLIPSGIKRKTWLIYELNGLEFSHVLLCNQILPTLVAVSSMILTIVFPQAFVCVHYN